MMALHTTLNMAMHNNANVNDTSNDERRLNDIVLLKLTVLSQVGLIGDNKPQVHFEPLQQASPN